MHWELMIIKKISTVLLFLLLLSGCAQNAALLGPSYTLATSGSVYQAGLTYSSNEAIYRFTGKSTSENMKRILTPKKQDNEFQKLVKKRIRETRKKLNFSN